MHGSNEKIYFTNNQKNNHMKNTKNQLLMRNENRIMNEYAMRLNITPMEIIQYNNRAHISDIRHLYCKLRHDWHGVNYSATGREIGRAHTTVKYGVKRINKLLMKNDKKILKMWNRVRDISGLYVSDY